MYPRTNYEMTEEDLKKLLDSFNPAPVMFLSGGTPMGSNTQDNANRAWRELGKKMGFDYESVRPMEGKGQRFFTAVPSETKDQKRDRVFKEKQEKRIAEIESLQKIISESQLRIEHLKNNDEF